MATAKHATKWTDSTIFTDSLPIIGQGSFTTTSSGSLALNATSTITISISFSASTFNSFRRLAVLAITIDGQSNSNVTMLSVQGNASVDHGVLSPFKVMSNNTATADFGIRGTEIIAASAAASTSLSFDVIVKNLSITTQAIDITAAILSVF